MIFSPRYLKAIWRPLLDHSSPGKLENRNKVVLHITEGGTAWSAIWTFERSVAPHRVSAHFVIDRDGTVYQLIDLDQSAWHASAVNSSSIGIEHAAISHKLMATEEQYKASAELVAWLCRVMKIPISREHVLTHYEASPKDRHTLCCTGALDPDRVVSMANEAARGRDDAVPNV